MATRGLLLGATILLAACAEGTGPQTSSRPSPEPAAEVSAEPSPSPVPVAEALLDGSWQVDVEIVELTTSVEGREQGQVLHREWRFQPGCAEGPCDVRVRRETDAGPYRHVFSYDDGRYTWEQTSETTCGGSTAAPAESAAVWVLDVTGAEEIDGLWRATRIEGTIDLTYRPSAAARAAGCTPGEEHSKFEGELVA